MIEQASETFEKQGGQDDTDTGVAGTTLGSAALIREALLRGSGAFVFSCDPSGHVLMSNAPSCRWFEMLMTRGESNLARHEVAETFIKEQPMLGKVIASGESASFRGLWREMLVEARVHSEDGVSLVTVHPCVVSGSRSTQAAHEIQSESVLDDLTPNEREVLELIGLGLKTKDIARIVHRSEKTIEARRSSIGRKLNLETRGELVRVAVRAGLSEL